MDDEGVWPLDSKQFVPASSLLYPDVVGHGIAFGEASSNLLSAAHVEIEACRIDKHGLESELIESYDDLEFYFETSKSCHTAPDIDELYADLSITSESHSNEDESNHGAEMEIFLISQMQPYSRLAVSEPVLKYLLSQRQVFSSFTDILTSFSIGGGNYSEGRSGFYTSAMTKIPREQSVAELCYLLKYVEPDVNSLSPVPWTIKHMAVYQKVDLKTQDTKCIIIQRSSDFQRRKAEIAETLSSCEDLSEHWTSLHSLLLGTLNKNWKQYLKSLDVGVHRIHTSLSLEVITRVTTTNIHELSVFVDLLLRFIHVQKLNIEVFNMLLQEARRPGGCEEFDKRDFSCRYRALEWAIDTTLSETKLLCSHAELVLGRANNAAAMLRDLIANQNTQLLQTIAQNTTKEESSPRAELQSTREISRESRSTKAITITMLVFYLPLIFTSTFLSIGFIHVTSAQNGLTVKASDDMWFYLALTLPLSIVTLAAWYVWEWRVRRRRMVSDLEENVKIE